MAARKNAQDMPPPPDFLSEPKYASFVFEHDCQASPCCFMHSQAVAEKR